MDAAAWRKRLEESLGKLVDAELLPLMDAEKAYGIYISQHYGGYQVATESFLAFFALTLTLADEQRCRDSAMQRMEWYAWLLLSQTVNFRRFRAAENLLFRGYPLAGYALLRDLKDQSLCIGAIINKITTWSRLLGTEGLLPGGTIEKADLPNIKGKRKKEERRVLAEMVGFSSGLDGGDRAELGEWEEMFHWEVHGSRLTLGAEGQEWLQGHGPLPIFPVPSELCFAMYANRSNEVAWLLLRTLPFLQPQGGAFGKEWMAQWRLLDDSFRYLVEDMEHAGKPIARAVEHLVDVKFAFSPSTTWYRE